MTWLAYPFPHRFAYQTWRGLAVDDGRDIAVYKAYTIGRWARARDYLDLHAILTGGVVSLVDLIRRAQETYGEAFSPRLFPQQLTYTQDLPDRDSALALLTPPFSFDAVAADLAQLVRDWFVRRFRSPSSAAGGPQ